MKAQLMQTIAFFFTTQQEMRREERARQDSYGWDQRSGSKWECGGIGEDSHTEKRRMGSLLVMGTRDQNMANSKSLPTKKLENTILWLKLD